MSVSTPCVGVCRLNERGVCIGCGRTLEQIAAWTEMDEERRQRIMQTLPGRELASARAHERAAPTAATAGAGPVRIVSLLPAATEMVFALGLGDVLVGVSHECNYPPAAKSRPAVVQPVLALEQMSQHQIDTAVSQRIASGESLYEIDEQLLQQLRPDLILTQDLCQVCAPSGNELTVALAALSRRPTVLPMTPHSLADVFENLRALGRATGRVLEAERLVAGWSGRLTRIQATAQLDAPPTRVFFMEWADPIYCSGHWVPEMIELAGGVDALSRIGRDSVRLPWELVLRWAPDVLILSPCGCTLEQAIAQLPLLSRLPGWSTLPAVRRGRVFCVDANAYFARPGPRVVEGTELLAHLLHPQRFEWQGPADAYRAVDTAG